MPYQTHWLYPSRVVVVKYSGVVTLDELQQQSDETKAMVASGDAPVHLIVDTVNMERAEANMRQLREIVGEKQPNIGWTVIIRRNVFVQFLSSLIVQMVKARYAFTDTLDDALTLLEDRDQTLTGKLHALEHHAREIQD